MTSSVTIKHNFETGHRLPHLSGKCQSLHGHSWWAEITVSAPTPAAGVVLEFSLFKQAVRGWIDDHLDHGLMLGVDDPLLPVLAEEGKVFIFDPGAPAPGLTAGLAWPTVENTAIMLGRLASSSISKIQRAPDARVTAVTVTETHVNRAGWTP